MRNGSSMRRGARRARTVVAAASIAAHVAVLAVLAFHVPKLNAPPPQPGGPPEPIIPVLLMPRALPPSPATGERPAPIRLHRRPQRFVAGETPVAPLVVPDAGPAQEPDETARRQARPAPPPENPVALNARNALRSRRNCDDPALTRAEREACMERLFEPGRDAPPLGLGLNRDKARELDAAARRREADYRYKRGLPGPPVPVPPGAGWDRQRSPPNGSRNMGGGASSEELGATPLKVPF